MTLASRGFSRKVRGSERPNDTVISQKAGRQTDRQADRQTENLNLQQYGSRSPILVIFLEWMICVSRGGAEGLSEAFQDR